MAIAHFHIYHIINWESFNCRQQFIIAASGHPIISADGRDLSVIQLVKCSNVVANCYLSDGSNDFLKSTQYLRAEAILHNYRGGRQCLSTTPLHHQSLIKCWAAVTDSTAHHLAKTNLTKYQNLLKLAISPPPLDLIIWQSLLPLNNCPHNSKVEEVIFLLTGMTIN